MTQNKKHTLQHQAKSQAKELASLRATLQATGSGLLTTVAAALVYVTAPLAWPARDKGCSHLQSLLAIQNTATSLSPLIGR